MTPEQRLHVHDELVSARRRGAWCLARAAACPWWRPLRRVLLIRAGWLHYLEANDHADLLNYARPRVREAEGGRG